MATPIPAPPADFIRLPRRLHGKVGTSTGKPCPCCRRVVWLVSDAKNYDAVGEHPAAGTWEECGGIGDGACS